MGCGWPGEASAATPAPPHAHAVWAGQGAGSSSSGAFQGAASANLTRNPWRAHPHGGGATSNSRQMVLGAASRARPARRDKAWCSDRHEQWGATGKEGTHTHRAQAHQRRTQTRAHINTGGTGQPRSIAPPDTTRRNKPTKDKPLLRRACAPPAAPAGGCAHGPPAAAKCKGVQVTQQPRGGAGRTTSHGNQPTSNSSSQGGKDGVPAQAQARRPQKGRSPKTGGSAAWHAVTKRTTPACQVSRASQKPPAAPRRPPANEPARAAAMPAAPAAVRCSGAPWVALGCSQGPPFPPPLQPSLQTEHKPTHPRTFSHSVQVLPPGATLGTACWSQGRHCELPNGLAAPALATASSQGACSQGCPLPPSVSSDPDPAVKRWQGLHAARAPVHSSWHMHSGGSRQTAGLTNADRSAHAQCCACCAKGKTTWGGGCVGGMARPQHAGAAVAAHMRPGLHARPPPPLPRPPQQAGRSWPADSMQQATQRACNSRTPQKNSVKNAMDSLATACLSSPQYTQQHLQPAHSRPALQYIMLQPQQDAQQSYCDA
jgi:hypothetical protein